MTWLVVLDPLDKISFDLLFSPSLVLRLAYLGGSIDLDLVYSGFWRGLSTREFLDKVVPGTKFLAFFVNP